MIRDFIDRRLKRSYGCDKPAAVRRVVAGRRGAVESGILPGGRKRAWSEMMPAREQAQPRSIQACKRANTTFIVATMRINSLHLKAAVAAVMALTLLCILFLKPSSTLPPDFQFQSHFSRRQAELYYAKTREELRQSYWDAIERDVKKLQLKQAWNRLKNGQGHIDGAVTNSNSDVMSFVKFRNGNSFWLTVQPARDRGLAKLP
jgi:hypothetical protein